MRLSGVAFFQAKVPLEMTGRDDWATDSNRWSFEPWVIRSGNPTLMSTFF